MVYFPLEEVMEMENRVRTEEIRREADPSEDVGIRKRGL